MNGITWIPLKDSFDLGFINEEEVNLFLFQSRVILPVLPIVFVSLYDHNFLMEDLFDYWRSLENSIPFVASLKFAHTFINNLFIEILSIEPSECTKSWEIE